MNNNNVTTENNSLDKVEFSKNVTLVSISDLEDITGDDLVFKTLDQIGLFKERVVVNVFDVAQYILLKLGDISTMKLQKLVYYCQAWSLVWDESPLFEEKIEAWSNGPVVRELFNFHRGRFSISNIPIGNPDIFDADQKETIDAVIDFYGDKSAQYLIDLSHMETPWKDTRGNMSHTEKGFKEIPLDVIALYYSSLE